MLTLCVCDAATQVVQSRAGCVSSAVGPPRAVPQPRRRARGWIAAGKSVIKCSPPLNVLKDTYRLDTYQRLMTDSPRG
jgi:hypothetical protein